jgi:hypothetical protein
MKHRITQKRKKELHLQGLKYCPSCKLDKKFNQFARSSYSTDGLFGHCIPCHRIRIRIWAKKHPETQMKWVKNNPESHQKSIKKWAKNNREKVLYMAANHIMKNRGLPMDLNFEEFKTIQHQPCHYCGKSDRLNSVDRIDSSKGYVKNNVQSACHICNSMKSNLSDEDFINQIKNMYKYIVKEK